jgi:hypothetical protein
MTLPLVFWSVKSIPMLKLTAIYDTDMLLFLIFLHTIVDF